MIGADISVDHAVAEVLGCTGSCCLDDLAMRLPHYQWNDIFLAVDRMARDGRLVLRRVSRSRYQLSLPARPAVDKEGYA